MCINFFSFPYRQVIVGQFIHYKKPSCLIIPWNLNIKPTNLSDEIFMSVYFLKGIICGMSWWRSKIPAGNVIVMWWYFFELVEPFTWFHYWHTFKQKKVIITMKWSSRLYLVCVPYLFGILQLTELMIYDIHRLLSWDSELFLVTLVKLKKSKKKYFNAVKLK